MQEGSADILDRKLRYSLQMLTVFVTLVCNVTSPAELVTSLLARLAGLALRFRPWPDVNSRHSASVH